MADALKTLIAHIAAGAPAAVAYSGGVDSTLVLAAACRAQGGRCLGLLARTPAMARREIDAALALAAANDWPVQVVDVDTLAAEQVARNRRERCYHCKRMLGTALWQRSRELGFARLLDGSQQDDEGELRPGARALAELNIESPLQELGFGKVLVRQLSAELGLANAAKPAAPCLLTRFPYDLPFALQPADLERAAAAEALLAPYCRDGFRVRQNGKNTCWLALSQGDAEAVFRSRTNWLPGLLALGFDDIKLDLLPLQSGAFD